MEPLKKIIDCGPGWSGGNTSATVIDKAGIKARIEAVCNKWAEDYPHELEWFKAQQKARKDANFGQRMFSPGKKIRAFASIPYILQKRLMFALKDRYWHLDPEVMNTVLSVFKIGKF